MERKKGGYTEKYATCDGKTSATAEEKKLHVEYSDTAVYDTYIRYTINFEVAPSEKVFAYLYRPKNISKLLPAILALHGTGAEGKKIIDGAAGIKNRAYAKELAERGGYVVIAPDYPSMGELGNYDFAKDRYNSGTMKGIYNHISCIDLLQSLPYVDKKRIGVIGHSLGGHNALFVAAFDPRIKVVVSSCGWTLFDYYHAGEKKVLFNMEAVWDPGHKKGTCPLSETNSIWMLKRSLSILMKLLQQLLPGLFFQILRYMTSIFL